MVTGLPYLEQDIGFEPMTFSLATKHSATELILQLLVPPKRLELSHPKIPEPKSGASTNFAKGALNTI